MEMNESRPAASEDAAFEAELAKIRRQRQNSGASLAEKTFMDETLKAIGTGNTVRLRALAEHVWTDPVLQPQAESLLNLNINGNTSLIVKAIDARCAGQLLPIETRSEMVRILLEAGAFPKKTSKANPVTLLVEHEFPTDILLAVNQLLVDHLGWKPNSVIPEMKPVLAQRGVIQGREQTNARPWAVRVEPTVAHPAQMPGLRRS